MKILTLNEPFDRFGRWFKEAEVKELNNPNAVAVATTTADGIPSVRMVLMKAWDERGFVFYTNFKSQKGMELIENPNAALLFHWKSLDRQVRIVGDVETVTEQEADDYFNSRHKASRIGAWASRQSEEMGGRFEFETEIAKYTAKYGLTNVPRPPHWSGFRVKPKQFEFWTDRQFRLHERHQYTLNDDKSNWEMKELFP